MTLTATTVKLALAGSLLVGAGTAPTVTVTAPGHSPKINVHWNYTVKVTVGGKPAAAKITEQIVDPLGTAHPVEFGKSTKNITNWPFKGTFADFIIWPASSRGIPLTLRIIVVAGGVKKTVNYPVTPQG